MSSQWQLSVVSREKRCGRAAEWGFVDRSRFKVRGSAFEGAGKFGARRLVRFPVTPTRRAISGAARRAEFGYAQVSCPD